MNLEVSQAVDELRRAFPGCKVDATDDGDGGARFVMDGVDLGERYNPRRTWLGAHIPALYPYADIYPVFMDAGVGRADGGAFQAPITPGAQFEGRPAIQISRRNNHAEHYPQTAVSKILKILGFLETYR